MTNLLWIAIAFLTFTTGTMVGVLLTLGSLEKCGLIKLTNGETK